MLAAIDVARDSYDALQKSGGFTLWTNREYQRTGYLVSSYDYERTISIFKPKEQVIDTMREFISKNYGYGSCLGFWADDNLIYCDVYDWTASMAEALDWAEERQQIDIYDLACGECIYLDALEIAA